VQSELEKAVRLRELVAKFVNTKLPNTHEIDDLNYKLLFLLCNLSTNSFHSSYSPEKFKFLKLYERAQQLEEAKRKEIQTQLLVFISYSYYSFRKI
jgi:hypothetical protein